MTVWSGLWAQCSSTVSSFPYVEDFENGAAWTSAGLRNSSNFLVNTWTWGSPTKTVINRAASGTKCWVTGGLTGSLYPSGERSYILSPCFDFSGVVRPYIQFKIWWESEYKYDGTNLQYSSDGGATWINVGSATDPVNCMNKNWYNYDHISNLEAYTSSGVTYPALVSVSEGWCGNIQSTSGGCQGGNGSANWVTASHCMPYLAGLASVQFRFTFGSGTSCNAFNGIAIDSVAIGEAPSNTADFSHSCVSTNTVSFQGSTTLCGDTFQWNFGDPASGASNTINGAGTLTPIHTFSAPGSYQVTLTVKGGPCNAPGSVTQTVNILSVSAAATNVLCYGGANGRATATVNGPAITYAYSWNSTPAQQTATATALVAGSYTVTVTAANACAATATTTVSQPTAITANTTVTNASCGIAADGSIMLSVAGGSPGYTYLWSNGATSQNISNLSGGNFTVTVTDSHQCKDTLAAVLHNAGALQVSLSSVNDSCYGTSRGISIVTASGATPPYTYLWSGGQTSDTITQLPAGIYTVTVFDNVNCTITGSDTITQPSAIQISDAVTNLSCYGRADGAIQITATGGNPGYSYLWAGGETTNMISNLPAGSYSVSVADQFNCQVSKAPIVVTEPGLLTLTMAATPQACDNILDGTVSVATSGGTRAYVYQWNLGYRDSSITGLPVGTYGVTVTDAHNCTAVDSATVVFAPSFTVGAAVVDPLCSPVNNGSIVPAPAGGTPGYSYVWSNGSTAAALQQLVPGRYVVTVTDARGCSLSDTFLLQYQNILTVKIDTDQTIDLGSSTQLTAQVNRGGDLTFMWTPAYQLSCAGCQSTEAAPIQTTQYSIQVSDSSGCIAVDSATIYVRKTYDVYIPNAFSPNNDGRNDYFEIYGKKSSWKYVAVRIFDRWGELVFESTDLNFKWDGTYKGQLVEPNVYVYVLDLTFADGHSIAAQRGSITLIR